MPHGGKRPGAGRKATRPPVARRVAVYLDEGEAKDLERLQLALGLAASNVMRMALNSFALR